MEEAVLEISTAMLRIPISLIYNKTHPAGETKEFHQSRLKSSKTHLWFNLVRALSSLNKYRSPSKHWERWKWVFTDMALESSTDQSLKMMHRATFRTWMRSWVVRSRYQTSQGLSDAKPLLHKSRIWRISIRQEEMSQFPTSIRLLLAAAIPTQGLTRSSSCKLFNRLLTRFHLAYTQESGPL